MPAGEADAVLDRLLQPFLLLWLDLRHRKGVDDQVEGSELFGVQVAVERVRNLDLEPLFFEPGGEDIDALFRLVSFPAPPDEEGFFLAEPQTRKIYTMPKSYKGYLVIG